MHPLHGGPPIQILVGGVVEAIHNEMQTVAPKHKRGIGILQSQNHASLEILDLALRLVLLLVVRQQHKLLGGVSTTGGRPLLANLSLRIIH